MLQSQFSKIFNSTVKKINILVLKKEKEYASAPDRLHNFNRAAEFRRKSRPEVLFGMLTKHLISVTDIVDDFEISKKLPTIEILEEKINDVIIYSILLKAIFIEEIEKKELSKKGKKTK